MFSHSVTEWRGLLSSPSSVAAPSLALSQYGHASEAGLSWLARAGAAGLRIPLPRVKARGMPNAPSPSPYKGIYILNGVPLASLLDSNLSW